MTTTVKPGRIGQVEDLMGAVVLAAGRERLVRRWQTGHAAGGQQFSSAATLPPPVRHRRTGVTQPAARQPPADRAA